MTANYEVILRFSVFTGLGAGYCQKNKFRQNALQFTIHCISNP